MKLKDWADKQGISYLTAWRWFKAGDPRLANAYQSDSGTIIVPDEFDSLEPSMGAVQSSSDVMSMVLKKTVEFSKNNAPVEDFAAWILSNFSLRPNAQTESPKYSRNKPKPEDIQEHFKQFLRPKGEKPKANMFTTEDPAALDDLVAKSDDLTAKELVDEIHKIGASAGAPVNPTDAPEVEDLMKDLSSAMSNLAPANFGSVSIVSYDDLSEGIVTRSVDLTPQPIDYTSSTSYTFSTNSTSAGFPPPPATGFIKYGDEVPQTNFVAAFQPTQKELESAARISTTNVTEKPRRGRKSLKGKK